MIGRPSLKTPEMVEEIASRLAKGEPLARICDDDHMPDFSTVWRWEENDPDFRNISTRARLHGTHYLADDCLTISDRVDLEPSDKKVRIDTRLRLIGKWNAKVYGDKQLLGSDPENPLPAPGGLDVSKLSDDVLREIRASMNNEFNPR